MKKFLFVGSAKKKKDNSAVVAVAKWQRRRSHVDKAILL